MAQHNITFTLNGSEVSLAVDSRQLLIHAIRDQLNQTGSHIGCETSEPFRVNVILCGDIEYKTHMAGVMAQRAITTALERAGA